MTNTRMWRKGEPEPAARIDPAQVPPEDYQTACRVLAASIRLALSDPAKRSDYEAWRRRREEAR